MEADRTVRAEQYCQSWFCVDPALPGYNPNAAYTTFTEDPTFQAGVATANAAGVSEVVQPWGQPQSEAVRLFVNAGYQLMTCAERVLRHEDGVDVQGYLFVLKAA